MNVTYHPPDCMGLSAIHPPAFNRMGMYGHRVVSITLNGPDSFVLGTACTSGVKDFRGEPCQGFMQFDLKGRGIELYLGVFNHHQACSDAAGYDTCTQPVENELFVIENFKETWQEILGSAKESAEKYRNAVQEKHAAAVERTGKDVERTGKDNGVPVLPPAVREAQTLLDSIGGLADLMRTYFRNRECQVEPKPSNQRGMPDSATKS